MSTELGPHASSVQAALERYARIRWLRPDAAMERLDEAAVGWLRDRADEHFAALAPHLSPDYELPAAAVATTRSLLAACARWERAWARDAAEGAPLSTRWSGALERARRRAAQRAAESFPSFATLQDTVRGAVDFVVFQSFHASRAWQTWFARAWNPEPPLRATAHLHALWLASFGDDPAHPSPWEPLVALWEAGTWPMALPDGTVFVYVPVLRGDDLVPEPTMPGVRAAPVRAPRAAEASTALPTLESLGFGAMPAVPPPPPTLAPSLPPPDLMPPPAGAAPPVRPGTPPSSRRR